MVNRDEEIFNGERAGYRLVIPGVMISADVSESYSMHDGLWHAVQSDAANTWHGKGDSKDGAYLSLIAARLGVTTAPERPVPPRRDDAVEAWIKRHRDQHDRRGTPSDAWYVLDDLLDDYRLHADTGTMLDLPVEGPRPADDADHRPDALRERLDALLAEALPLAGGRVRRAIVQLQAAFADLDTERARAGVTGAARSGLGDRAKP